MTKEQLRNLSEERRIKVLKVLEKDALISVRNYRLNLTDWKRQYDVLELLKKCGYNSELLTEALLNVSVATRTIEEDNILNSYREKMKSIEVAKLNRVKR